MTLGDTWIQKPGIALYFHIPFCAHKCPYCHFFSLPNKETLKERFFTHLQQEWLQRAPLIQKHQVQEHPILSVYFGGGTPSLLGPKRIQTIFSWIPSHHPREITLEANPETVSSNLIRQYAEIGINRISFGVQSLNPHELTLLGRQHSVEQAVKAVEIAKYHNLNTSIDLMYDLPSQTLQTWENTLRHAAALPVDHISLYNLTLEPRTVFFKKRAEIQKQLPIEQDSLAMYQLAQEILSSSSSSSKSQFTQYEISAFARNENWSRHNVSYWVGRPFLGFGPSAFSYWEGNRFRNAANLKNYNNHNVIDFEETLSPQAQRRELLVIRLRLIDGLDLTLFEQRWGQLDAETKETLQRLKEEGLLTRQKNHLALTQKGVTFYDTVASELI